MGGAHGRIDAALIAEAAYGSEIAFVCGTNGFVEAATMLLMDAGLEAGGFAPSASGRPADAAAASRAVDVSISGLPFVLGVNRSNRTARLRSNEMTEARQYMERRWIALLLLCFAQFIVVIDASIVNVALPSIGEARLLPGEPVGSSTPTC